MAIESLDIHEFLSLAKKHPVFDVRSPGEYLHAHIPGAHSFPLFSDEERKVVGTTYKQQSREEAIKIGLVYFGPKMRTMVEAAEKMIHAAHPKGVSPVVLVHCWRGGMRSAAIAWLLHLYGFKVYTLKGGYKSFRHLVLQQFEKSYPLQILGGYTGSGKTALLKKLARVGENMIDLEALAHHKGSAFGHFGQEAQPSQEMFENKLATALLAYSTQENKGALWLEDESLRIGNIFIPHLFYKQMRKATCWFADIPFEKRLQYICRDYGTADKEKLINATLRIQKRLGGLETKTAINFLIENNIEGAFRVLLAYYDKWYLKGLYSKDGGERTVVPVNMNDVDETLNSQLLLQQLHKQQQKDISA